MPRIGQSATKSRNKFLVYRLKNKINGKSYIGITCRAVSARWCEHLQRVREGQRVSRLYAAMRKYGVENFSKEILARVATDAEVRVLETHFIHKFDSYHNGYNSNLGGHGFLEIPDHIKKKIGAAQKGKIIPAETRARMSLAKLGKSECAAHFGDHTKKGAGNPRAERFKIRFPDGSEHVICGLRAFSREHDISMSHLKYRGQTKGYQFLGRLNDHPHAGSTAKRPEIAETREGQNMVYSAPKDAALGNGLGL